MKTTVVLAMHGAPPNNFPLNELAELIDLQHRLERTTDTRQEGLQKRHEELETKIRTWPRSPLNDPFYAGSIELAKHLEVISGLPVVLGFNEFCAPRLDEALEQAASNAEQVLVITPMMTRGGEHSEQDIPASIHRAQKRHPELKIQYVWPYEVSEVARFLSEQLKRFQ